jgi:hypothetical protein
MSTPNRKPHPYNVRLDDDDEQELSELTDLTGMTRSEIFRRACKFAFPKFRSGEVDISRVVARRNPSGSKTTAGKK